MSKKRAPSPVVVLPDLPLTEVWAVVTDMPDCHDDDCYCDGGEGTAMIALFASEQTARQFADHKNREYVYEPYRAQKMPVHTSMKNVY